MKTKYTIAVWAVVAIAGSVLWGGSILGWLAGLYVGRFFARILIIAVVAIGLYILFYVLIVVGVLWILIG